MHNPLETVTPSLEQGLKLPRAAAPFSHNSKHTTADSLRIYLLTAMERCSVRQSHAAVQCLSNTDLRRDLALIRRTDQGQLCILNQYAPRYGSETETLLSHFLLVLTLAAHMAQRAGDASVRKTLDFIIPEYQDMLYRIANLMAAQGHSSVTDLTGGFAEIMPGRPMIACHRHPYDDISSSSPELTQPDCMALIMTAAVEEAIIDQLLICMRKMKTPLEKSLCMELSLIAEQHLSLISSLIPSTAPLEMLLHIHYAEAFLYDSCWREEDDPAMRQFYLEEKEHELAHMQKLTEMILLETGRKPALSPFPDPLILTPQKGYVRETLKNSGVTLLRGKCIPVGALKKGADFFRYQKKICATCTDVPSHQIIMSVIEKNGMDFRYEIAPHPIQLLRNRENDPTDIGR